MSKHKYLLLFAFFLLATASMHAQQFFFSAERPTTCGASDGIITIVPTRGVPPFTYSWSTGATEVSLRNIPKGTYSATLTDANGSTVAHTYILNSVELDLALADSKPSSTCNPLSGELTLSPLGGTAPYAYVWSNGQTGAVASGLNVGTYSVTATDALGCVAVGEYLVTTPPFYYYPTADIATSSEPDCANPTNGELEAQMLHSGYAPYAYTWNTGATSATLTALTDGIYSVTITDALGCNSVKSINLRKKLTMTGSVVCTGNNSGTANALLENATAPVAYSWNTGQTGSSLSNLGNGLYQVTATDANGCSSTGEVSVAVPFLQIQENTPKCYTGDAGSASTWVSNDQMVSTLWDNGGTQSWNTTLSAGIHTVNVTTALGCTLVGTVNIPAPVAAPYTFSYTATPADCLNGTGGELNVSISGGLTPYNFYAYGPDGFYTSDISSLQNVKAGDYYLTAYAVNQTCYGQVAIHLSDLSGFEPTLEKENVDCSTGYGSAKILNVTTPGTQYTWSNGATTSDTYNLTPGGYAVTVSAGGDCVRYFNFYLENLDSLQTNCSAVATGQLINDLGNPGCNGTTGIPFQLIRTLPSGALNFTDANGIYAAPITTGTFDIETAHYDPADIACPVGAKYTVNAVQGATVPNLDFHFLNNNPIDHRIEQQPLRTAQPGYPYSVRFNVCNDGNSANAGTLQLDYGNFLGSVASIFFAQHAASFSLLSETAGLPNNTAVFSFSGITPGTCELLQVDFTTPTTTPGATVFENIAQVSPASGDPTPDNNVSELYNTVVGSFDPNCVLAYPARNGNPKDGGEILATDRVIHYQVFFQNTGTAAADQVIVRDTLDANLDASTIRNISASHEVKVSFEHNNQVLVFKFPNIGLPDSTSDYAGSIGSLQYDIDAKPGLVLGDEIKKQVAIFFDFNAPVITNRNVLELADPTSVTQTNPGELISLKPNPADASFLFYCDTTAEMSVFNALGAVVLQRDVEAGQERVNCSDWPAGMYLVKLVAKGKVYSGKVVVSH